MRQEEACRHLAAARGYDIVEVCADISISAFYGKDRPGWRRVFELIELGAVDIVMAWHIDRMTRRMVDLEQLIVLAEERHVGVVTVTGDIDLTNETGRMVGRILAAVARAEIERKSARIALANRQAATEGRVFPTAPRPFGYEADGVTIRRDEADAFVKACKDYLAGTSTPAIMREWNEAGFVSSTAKRNPDGTLIKDGWTCAGVRSVLKNPRYAGLRCYHGEVVGEGIWEPLIDLETHLAVRSRFAERRQGRPREWSGRIPQNLLTGIMTCGVCDKTVVATFVLGTFRYVCPYQHVFVERYQADALVRTTVAQAGREYEEARWGRDGGPCAKAAEELRQRLAELALVFARGAMTVDEFEAAAAPIKGSLRHQDPQGQAPVAWWNEGVAAAWQQAARLLVLDLDTQRRTLAKIATIRLNPRHNYQRLTAKDVMAVTLRRPNGEKYAAFSPAWQWPGHPADPRTVKRQQARSAASDGHVLE